MAGKTGPASVAEGLGDVLRAITDTLTAPDAPRFAGPLMKLQTDVLDLVHKQMAPAAGGGGAPGAAPAGGPAPAPGGPSPLAGGLAGLQGGPPQGPSAAVSPGGGPSLSGIDPAQLAGVSAGGGDDEDAG